MADRDSVLDASQIEDATITENELNTSVAGNGVTGGGGSALAVDPDITSTTTTEANAVIVGANGVSVKVDDASLEGSLQGVAGAETLRIKDSGVTTAKINADAVTNAKIATNGASGLSVGLEFATVKSNAGAAGNNIQFAGAATTDAGSQVWTVFGTAFAATPIVVAMNQDTINEPVLVPAGSITTGSFQAISTSASEQFMWIACGSGRV